MLKMKILEEEIVKIKQGPYETIVLYLRLGRFYIDILNGDMKVLLAIGIDEREKICFNDEQPGQLPKSRSARIQNLQL